MYQIILASESPRRKEIMEMMGIPFRAIASNVEETVQESEPDRLVEALAALKAEHIFSNVEYEEREDQDSIIIGADTMVFYDGQALGKPQNEAEACKMLQMLSGSTHEVYTGVHIILWSAGKKQVITFAECTRVFVQPMSMKQIEDYVATGEPMDKAGAYGIQGRFGIHIRGIEGDYYNVVGFPIAKIYEILFTKGIDIKKLK